MYTYIRIYSQFNRNIDHSSLPIYINYIYDFIKYYHLYYIAVFYHHYYYPPPTTTTTTTIFERDQLLIYLHTHTHDCFLFL